jgi:hypothetical protein
MDFRKSTLERAFELAESGRLASVAELRAQLKREGHTLEQLTGRALMSQLRFTIKARRTSSNGGTVADEIEGRARHSRRLASRR